MFSLNNGTCTYNVYQGVALKIAGLQTCATITLKLPAPTAPQPHEVRTPAIPIRCRDKQNVFAPHFYFTILHSSHKSMCVLGVGGQLAGQDKDSILIKRQKVSEYDQEYHNHTLHTNPRHHDESHRTFTVTRYQEDNKSKETSSLFLVNMITKLERTLSNA